MRFTAEDIQALADAVWAEARGESRRGQRAVAHVIVNRAAAVGAPLRTVVYAKNQFTGLTPGDVNRKAVEAVDPNDPAYRQVVNLVTKVAAGDDLDPTDGALFYHTDAVAPAWRNGRGFEKTSKIGAHQFYRAPVREVKAHLRGGTFKPVASKDLTDAIPLPVDRETGELIADESAPRPGETQPTNRRQMAVDNWKDKNPFSSSRAVAGVPAPKARPDGPPPPVVSFTDYARGLDYASPKTEAQVGAMTDDGKQLMADFAANLDRMEAAGMEVPDVTITSGKRNYSTDRRTHPTGGAFDVRTRDLPSEQVRAMALAATAAGAKGLGNFDPGLGDPFAEHMHIDNVGAFGMIGRGSRQDYPDLVAAVLDAGRPQVAARLQEAMDKGVQLPEGIVTGDFARFGVIPDGPPRGKPAQRQMAMREPENPPAPARQPDPETAVAALAEFERQAPVPAPDRGGWLSAYAGEMPPAMSMPPPAQASPVPPQQGGQAQGTPTPAGSPALPAASSPVGAAQMPGTPPVANPSAPVPGPPPTAAVPPPAPSSVPATDPTQPANAAPEMLAAVAPGEEQAAMPPEMLGAVPPEMGGAVPPEDPNAAVPPPEALPGQEVAEMPLDPQMREPENPPRATVANPFAGLPPTPEPRPGGLGLEPIDEAPVEVPELPPVAEVAPAPSVAPPVDPVSPDARPRGRPEMRTIGGTAGKMGGGLLGAAFLGGPGMLLGRELGERFGNWLDNTPIRSVAENYIRPPAAMDAAVEAAYSTPDGALNSPFDSAAYWKSLSESGFTNSDLGMKIAMSREQQLRKSAGQKTWADAFDLKKNVGEPVKNALVPPQLRSAIDEVKSILSGAKEKAKDVVTAPLDAAKQIIADTTRPDPRPVAPPTDPGKEALKDAVQQATPQPQQQTQQAQQTTGGSEATSEDDGSTYQFSDNDNDGFDDRSIGGLY